MSTLPDISNILLDVISYMTGFNPHRAVGDIFNSARPYYLNIEFNLYNGHFNLFDENSIPVRRYKTIGVQYNPTRVAGYALAQWNTYIKTRSKDCEKTFLRQADWFVDTAKAKNKNNFLAWEYSFDLSEDLKAPWISGMAQGQSLSVLGRAFVLTGDDKYAEIARGGLGGFKVDVEDGGVIDYYRDGAPCIEEFPSKGGTPSHVLNGFIIALFGLYDYIEMVDPKSTLAKQVLSECVNALKQNLWRYDTGYWSRYDLIPGKGINACTCSYHGLHIAQLKALYGITGEETFLYYSSRWETYRKKLLNRLRALLAKTNFRIQNPALR